MTQSGADLRDAAIERVERAAREEWLAAAFRAAEYVCRERGPEGRFTTDAVWAVLARWSVPAPREPRAMGPVMKRVEREGLAHKTNRFVRTTLPQGHRRPVQVYEVNP
jgi:hypothetical protein